MELRSSRRLTRSSDPRLKQRTFSRTHAARVSSRLPSSGNNRLCRELAHSNPDAARVYQLRSGEFPVKSERHRSTSRLGLSQSAHSKVESASPKLSSGIRDNSYRGRLGNIAIPSSILRECSVCIESKGKRQFPSLDCLPKCGHITSVCKSCVLRHTIGQLETHGQWHQVFCLECSEPLGESYFEAVGTRRDLQKLRSIVARKALEADPRFRACLAAKCGSGQIHENIHTDIVICNSCGSKSCFNHGVPWHEGYTCDRYDDSHPDAASLRTSEDRLRALAKKCPGEGCKFFVEKDGGCDSMWCSICRKSWNWASVNFGGDETMFSQT